MITAMDSIQDMVDVNTIIGEPIEAGNNTTIIPISKVSFGFAAGGSEFKGETIDEYSKKEQEEMIQYRLPFGGGSGAGVSISPVAFLVVGPDCTKLLPVKHSSALDKLLDCVPDLFDKVNETIEKTPIMKKKKKKDVEDDSSDGTKSKLEEITEQEVLNTRRRPRKRAQKTSYEFDYSAKKPETHVDEEVLDYIDTEELDD